MTGALCDWTRLPVDQCAHCNPDPPAPIDPATDRRADNLSACPRCKNWIWPGEPIALVDGAWVCEGCAP